MLETAERFALGEDASRSNMITLAQVKDVEIFDRITVKCKVMLVKDVVEVFTEEQKQDVKVGYESKVGLIILWEEIVGRPKSYIILLKKFSVCEYGFSKYLSVLKDESEILATDDIGHVLVDRDNDDEQNGGSLSPVQIVAAPQIDLYKSCLACKARVEPCDPPLGMQNDVGERCS